MRQVAGEPGNQMPIQHLARGIREVGQLQQQEAHEKFATDAVEANHRRSGHSYQRCHQRPWVEPPIHGVFDQSHVQRCKNGEQQNLGYAEHAKAQIKAHVGDAVLQGAYQQHRAHKARFYLPPPGQRQKDQARQHHAGKHGKITVDVTGQILAYQAERERLDKRDDDQIAHGCLSKIKVGTLAG